MYMQASVPLTQENLCTLYVDCDDFEFDSDCESDANDYDPRHRPFDVFREAEELYGYGPWDNTLKVAAVSWLLEPHIMPRWDPDQESCKYLFAKLGTDYGKMAILSKAVREMTPGVRMNALGASELDDPRIRDVFVLFEGVVMRVGLPCEWVNLVDETMDDCVQKLGFF